MRNRIVRAILLVLLVLPACTVWKEKPASRWSQATGGEQLERLFWQDLRAQKWLELESRMSSTWVFLTPSGPLDRAATLQHMKQVQLSEYSLGDFSIAPGGNDMIVTYTATVHGTLNGQPLPATPVRMMTVWQKSAKGWIAIAHADTPARSE
jgi:hypothetical protein